MPPSPPHYASLLVGDTQFDALEFSAAGLSLSPTDIERTGLRTLRRGDECEATLYLGGAEWEEHFDVVLRLAARGPVHVGFAFVNLPPSARRLLGRVPVDRAANESDGEGSSFGGAPWGGRPAPFAFARLVEREAPARRLVLSASAAVLAVTKRRNRENGRCPKTAAPRPIPRSMPIGVLQLGEREPSDLASSTLFVYGLALLAVLTVFWAVVFG